MSAPDDIVAELRHPSVAEAIDNGVGAIHQAASEFCVSREEFAVADAEVDALEAVAKLVARAADEIERLRPYRDILAKAINSDGDVYVALDDDAMRIDGWVNLTPAEVQALRALEAPR